MYMYIECREGCVMRTFSLNYYSLKAYRARMEFSVLFQRAILEIHARHEIKSRQIKETVVQILTRGVFTRKTPASRLIFFACLDSRFTLQNVACSNVFSPLSQTKADGNISTITRDRFFETPPLYRERCMRARRPVICNQLKANKPGADWTTVHGNMPRKWEQ